MRNGLSLNTAREFGDPSTFSSLDQSPHLIPPANLNKDTHQVGGGGGGFMMVHDPLLDPSIINENDKNQNSISNFDEPVFYNKYKGMSPTEL